MRRKVVGRFKKKLSLYQVCFDKDKESFCACVNSYFGHFLYANSFGLRKRFGEKIEKDGYFEIGEKFAKVLICLCERRRSKPG